MTSTLMWVWRVTLASFSPADPSESSPDPGLFRPEPGASSPPSSRNRVPTGTGRSMLLQTTGSGVHEIESQMKFE